MWEKLRLRTIFHAMIPMRPWRLVHWKNIPEELCFASIMGLICTVKTNIKTEMYFRTLQIKKKPAHLEISGRMNEKEKWSCKSVQDQDFCFVCRQCLWSNMFWNIFKTRKTHITLNLRFPFESGWIQGTGLSISKLLTEQRSKPFKFWRWTRKTISDDNSTTISFIKSPYYVLEI